MPPARKLPARPSLEQLKKQAKELLDAVRARDEAAIARFRASAPRAADARHPRLSEAQHAVAQEYGFATWSKLTGHVRSMDSDVDPFVSLSNAVRANNLDAAAATLRRHPELKDRLDEPAPNVSFGGLLIHAATGHQNRAMLDLLLHHGASIDAHSVWWAGGFGVLDSCEPAFARALIERGAFVDAPAAARLGMLERLDELVTLDPSAVHSRGGDGQTPLHVAANLDIARYLVEHGADIDALDVDHESTPAQYLVRDHQDIVRYLIERGCRTDILMAAAIGDIALVRRHLDANPDAFRMRVSDQYFPKRDPRAGGSIYIWTLGNRKSVHAVAREFGHDDIFQLLIDASPDALKLALACELGDQPLFARLIAKRPDLAKTLSPAEGRILVDAAETNNDTAVRMLLAAGWPVDATGDLGATALHFASWLGNLDMVSDILRRDPPIHARSAEYDSTPLQWAFHGSENSWRCKEGNYPGVVEALIAAGASVPEESDAIEASPAVRELLQRRAQRPSNEQ